MNQAIERLETAIENAEDEFEKAKNRMKNDVVNGYDISSAAESYYHARENINALKTVLFQLKEEGLEKTSKALNYRLTNGSLLPINDGIKRIEEYWRFRAFASALDILMI